MSAKKENLKSIGILKLSRDLRITDVETQTARFVDPPLIEGNKQIIPGFRSPTKAALPPQVPGAIVKLH